MPIHPATSADLATVRRLFHTTSRSYTDYGSEDLPYLLQQGYNVLGTAQDHTWGVLCASVEERPPTLPPSAATRGQIRCVAEHRHAPVDGVTQLAIALISLIRERRQDAVQLICYGQERWLMNALKPAAFSIVDRVQFFLLERLVLPSQPHSLDVGLAELTPAQSSHLDALAELDAAAFPPLWHFGHKDMLELLMRCWMPVALVDGRVAGYAAVAANNEDEAQLARLAVHPDMQRQGVGHRLVAAAIQYAADSGYDRLVLNTQIDNQRSQRLYRRFGFYPIGQSIPVLAAMIGQNIAVDEVEAEEA